MRTNWKKFWAEHPLQFDEREFLRQVGHTEQGVPYSQSSFDAMVMVISRALSLAHEDRLLDVCCGNGVVTAALATQCSDAIGVDFSQPLIQIATEYHGGPNLAFEVKDALSLRFDEALACRGKFDCVLMYAALQHFERADLPELLAGLSKHTAESGRIMIGGIPDIDRRDEFLTTRASKLRYRYYQLRRRDRIGTWWSQAEIVRAASTLGLHCVVDDHSAGRPGGHYRFDVILSQD